MRDIANAIRSFGMSGYLITEELSSIEEQFGLEFDHLPRQVDNASNYYFQFDQQVRKQAADMATHYELFYCLEQSIRQLITRTLIDKSGSTWWNDAVPPKIVSDVNSRIQREIDSGFSQRSDKQIDYTNFGELSVIINSNWDVFGAIFSSQRAVERIMNSLNLLRGPIAHCSPLAGDEIDRLLLTVKDWLRAMA